MKEYTTYVAYDGKRFSSKEDCEEHEKKLNQFKVLVESKIGEFQLEEMRIGGRSKPIKVTSLPFKAPWMTAFGVGLVNIVDISRNEGGRVVFTIADENNIPYKDEYGNEVKVHSQDFYPEWPQ